MLGRRAGATRAEPEVVVETPAARAAGKGRPTPRRRDAEAERRARARPPRNRKEAAVRRRDNARVERERTRAAMLTGDDRGLPARDRGPVKRFVRETVDSRRHPLEFMLPAMIVVLFGETALSSVLVKDYPKVLLWLQYGFYAVVILVLVLAYSYGRSLRRLLEARFGETGEDRRGAVLYGVTRAVTIRRLRMPRPKRAA